MTLQIVTHKCGHENEHNISSHGFFRIRKRIEAMLCADCRNSEIKKLVAIKEEAQNA